jgi:hypothetical protein
VRADIPLLLEYEDAVARKDTIAPDVKEEALDPSDSLTTVKFKELTAVALTRSIVLPCCIVKIQVSPAPIAGKLVTLATGIVVTELLIPLVKEVV